MQTVYPDSAFRGIGIFYCSLSNQGGGKGDPMALRPITYPTRIVWATRGKGLVTESQKKRLIAESQRQMGILLRDMKFQHLSQGRRLGLSQGFKFNCTSTMGLNSVSISLIKDVGGVKEIVRICWCGCQMALGVVMEVIERDTGGLCVPNAVPSVYPDCALTDLGKYAGKRYIVKVCQEHKWMLFCCTSTDFEEYEAEDKVIVLYIGYWKDDWEGIFSLSDCGKFACKGVVRDKETDLVLNGIDGQFIILPYDMEPDE